VSTSGSYQKILRTTEAMMKKSHWVKIIIEGWYDYHRHSI